MGLVSYAKMLKGITYLITTNASQVYLKLLKENCLRDQAQDQETVVQIKALVDETRVQVLTKVLKVQTDLQK